jgi:hypothetical protein
VRDEGVGGDGVTVEGDADAADGDDADAAAVVGVDDAGDVDRTGCIDCAEAGVADMGTTGELRSGRERREGSLPIAGVAAGT